MEKMEEQVLIHNYIFKLGISKNNWIIIIFIILIILKLYLNLRIGRLHLKLNFNFFSVACLKVHTLAKNWCQDITEIGTF